MAARVPETSVRPAFCKYFEVNSVDPGSVTTAPLFVKPPTEFKVPPNLRLAPELLANPPPPIASKLPPSTSTNELFCIACRFATFPGPNKHREDANWQLGPNAESNPGKPFVNVPLTVSELPLRDIVPIS